MIFISVILPVYNTELYIAKAIESILIQPEVIEIIIVDDGSTDKSLSICEDIANNNDKIKIFQHYDKKNHGRSASKNLGIRNAKGNYIAFLDADDFYLPNRFLNDIKIFSQDKSVDGVYNSISAHFYRESNLTEKNKLQLTSIRDIIKPDKLFERMGPFGHMGYFSGIGLTVKRGIFEKVGYFNESLAVAEDTELWVKMALKANLTSGFIDKPLAMRGVHYENVSFKNDDLYTINNLLMYEALLIWSFKEEISLSRIDLIWKKVWISRALNNKEFYSDLIFWKNEILIYPRLLLLKSVYKNFPVFKKIKTYFSYKR